MKCVKVVKSTAVMAVLISSLASGYADKSRREIAPTPTIHSTTINRDVPPQERLDVFRSAAAPETTTLGYWDFDTPGIGCDAQGWVSEDVSAQDAVYFHVDDFAGLGGGDFGRLVPIEGLQSLWLGTRDDGSITHCNYRSLPGYGDGWRQLFVEDSCLTVTGDVTIDYLQTYDLDDGWDFLYAQYDTCDGLWTSLGSVTGIGSEHSSYAIPAAQHNGKVRLRLFFFSDWGWSDEDGLWNSDGASIIDSLTVSDATGQVLPTELFEAESVGDTATLSGNWHADVVPGFGDFAGMYYGSNEVQEDPCVSNTTCLWAFISGSTYDYSCRGYPGQNVVPYPTGTTNGEFIENEIWSPLIPYSDNGGDVKLTFDVYGDLMLNALIFYVWHVRSWVNGCPGSWRDTNFVFYAEDLKWRKHDEHIKSLIDPTADHIQVAIGVTDMCWTWCGWIGTGQCHSHAPLIDNVHVFRVDSHGPVWSVQTINLFQDNFASDGTLTGTVRADIASDILPAASMSILPGDSAVVEATVPGSALATDPYTGIGPAAYAYVSVWPQNQIGKSGPELTDDASRYPVVDSLNFGGVTWYQVRLDTVVASDGSVVQDLYCLDLNDNLFTPGDTVWFFFGAVSDTPFTEVTYWSEFTGTTDDIAKAAALPMEFTCLPAGGWTRGGDILYVDGADGTGAQGYFDTAFKLLGIGHLVDRYDVRLRSDRSQPSANGPASRVVNVYQQILGCYRKIIWNTGRIEYGPGDGSSRYNGLFKQNDYALLLTFADHLSVPGGLYLSGDMFAREWDKMYASDATNLRNTYCNFGYPGDIGPGAPPYPRVMSLAVGETGSLFEHAGVPDSLVAFGGCPEIRNFNIVNAGALSSQAMSYDSQGSGTGAVVSQETINVDSTVVGVVLSGFGFDAVRDDRPTDLPDRAHHLHDILSWLENVLPYPTGGRGPGLVNALSQNYPNPFNPATTITYSITHRGAVSLKVYNVSGQLIRTLVDETKTPGIQHKVTWDGRNNAGQSVASGVYFYRLVSPRFTQTKKMVILK